MSAGVYFAQCGTGPIKVGFSEIITKRISALRTSSHEEVSLIATVPGNRNAERYFHALLAPWRLQGEWFSPSHEVLEFIKDVQERGVDVLPPNCILETDDNSEDERILDALRQLCKRYIVALAHPLSFEEAKVDALKRVAQATGVSFRTIRMIEYNEAEGISAITLLRLRKAFVEKYIGPTEMFEIDLGAVQKRVNLSYEISYLKDDAAHLIAVLNKLRASDAQQAKRKDLDAPLGATDAK